MFNETMVLMGTALSIGFFHTVFGPDHYLPFIAMAKARRWNMLKTGLITLFCGLGHVLSSVILGFLGIVLGIAVFKLEGVESFRGDIAAWFLLIFGFTYFIWGLHMAIRNKPHVHHHEHGQDGPHEHVHTHNQPHLHLHADKKKASITPWILFTIFVFGPCEPLIPLLMYPAAKGNMLSVLMVTVAFSVTTIATMLILVLAFSYGLLKFSLGPMERYAHAIAGFTIFLCGGLIKFFGL